MQFSYSFQDMPNKSQYLKLCNKLDIKSANALTLWATSTTDSVFKPEHVLVHNVPQILQTISTKLVYFTHLHCYCCCYYWWQLKSTNMVCSDSAQSTGRLYMVIIHSFTARHNHRRSINHVLLKTLQLWSIKTTKSIMFNLKITEFSIFFCSQHNQVFFLYCSKMTFNESPELCAVSTNHTFFDMQMLQSGTHYNAITSVSFLSYLLYVHVLLVQFLQ